MRAVPKVGILIFCNVPGVHGEFWHFVINDHTHLPQCRDFDFFYQFRCPDWDGIFENYLDRKYQNPQTLIDPSS